MQAVILVGHGSLRKASGAAMIRLAALVRKEKLAPISTAGFLNFSRPTFLDAVARCAKKGATEITVQPYFLISGYYVSRALPKLVEEARAMYPTLDFEVAQAFGYHSALIGMVLKRARAASPQLPNTKSALLLMAHGTPRPEANKPIYEIAREIESRALFSTVRVSFMELNSPTISGAIDDFVNKGVGRITAVPYFLQLGGHVAEDLPEAVKKARARHKNTELYLTDYLSYDPLLLEVVRTRVEEAKEKSLSAV